MSFAPVTINNMTPDELARYYPDPLRDAVAWREYLQGRLDAEADMEEDYERDMEASAQSARDEIIAITLATLNV